MFDMFAYTFLDNFLLVHTVPPTFPLISGFPAAAVGILVLALSPLLSSPLDSTRLHRPTMSVSRSIVLEVLCGILCYCVADCDNDAINALMCACDKVVLTQTFSAVLGTVGINHVEISI